MTDHNILNELEEMYLLSIVRSAENEQTGPIPVTQVAEWMQVQPVTANHMVHKLQEMGLVAYLPYQGVLLTPEGQKITNQVLRRRRLWEVFLVEHLHLSPAAADALACKLEHNIPAEVADRLDVFLGSPAYSPQGLAIPAADSPLQAPVGMGLDQLPAGAFATVWQIQTDAETRAYLSAAGVQIGTPVEVLASTNGGPVLVRTSTGKVCQISREMCAKVQVQPG